MGITNGEVWLDALDRTLLTEAQIQQRVGELAQQISADYTGRSPLVVGVLTGAFIFTADLVRHLNIPLNITFIRAASYGDHAYSSGQVAVAEQELPPIVGRDVLLVEDIIDTGHTLTRLRVSLEKAQAASLAVCCLLDKPACREVPVGVDYTGFTIPKEFVVGYGLDFRGRYRHLSYIAALKPEVYQGIAE